MKCRRLTVVIAVSVLAWRPCAPAQAISARRLLINQDFPDPDVVKTGACYFAFSTSTGQVKVPVAAAPAPDGPWRGTGDALATPPPWAKPGGGFWAPDVTTLPDGTFVLYFASTVGASGQMCLGTATASEPDGPYQPSGDQPIGCAAGDGGDIDPQTFLDSDGTRYLLYKSDGTPTGPPAAIWSQKLSPDGRTLAGTHSELIRADLTAEKGVVEAPSVVKTLSRYLLFYSADTFTSSGYHTCYATAPTLSGPFVKADSQFLSTDLLGGRVDTPGVADVADGHIFFHGWLSGGRSARGLSELPISFPGDTPQLG
ncbi:glycoside hydrolase family 43 protein [Amycolatopsis sp. FDAARGOS 1241]|uniref:glycoside hydrolase family 43 protein n=1 Tax=Amycolatopsis sp. FDAARGOS 1241 TaxID=2778070 RepID=UPI00194F49D8|nr:glycoside hydrolase family 43 protein [Amycolatopsis sp. FDAARGOS 1241]QRP48433.1 family 43 glycosylhydrolase [Amycolatopsis sp. FDAARGOS 1241]